MEIGYEMNQFEKFVLYRQSCSDSVMCLKSEITIQISESVEIKREVEKKGGRWSYNRKVLALHFSCTVVCVGTTGENLNVFAMRGCILHAKQDWEPKLGLQNEAYF